MRALAIATLTAATWATAASLVVPANAATIASYKIAGWNVGAYTNDSTSRFSHCAASAEYRNGLILLFSVSESLQWSIGFSSPEWNLRQGREFNIEYRIDGGRINEVRGMAASNRLIRAPLPDSVELFNQFRQGYRLVVSVNDNPQASFNLTNTNPMLIEILRCAQKYKGHIERADRPPTDRPPASRNPDMSERDLGTGNTNRPLRDERNTGVGSSGSYRERNPNDRVARAPDRDERPSPDRDTDRRPAENRPAIGPTPESRSEATTIATDILRRANFTFEFQKTEQLAANMRDRYDVVWRSDEFLGTLRILPDTRAETIDRVRADATAADAANCKGKFDSGALPAPADSKSVTIFTTCKGEQTSSAYYIILPRRKGGIYLLGVLGSGEAAERLQGVATAYRTVALEVIEK